MSDAANLSLVIGARCQIVRVHWRCDIRKLGKVLVLAQVNNELGTCFAYNDEPVTYRLNRKGRKIVDHDPRCIQTVYLLADLRPLPAGDLLA